MPALRASAQNVDVVAVVTQPDRRSGRGQKKVASPIKSVARDLGLDVWQPQTLRTFSKDHAGPYDLFILASYGKILPQEVLTLPRLGALNIHPSLLPTYRGASPIQMALRNGDEKTGVSIMLMDAGMDTGPLLLQEPIDIQRHDDYGTLHGRLSQQGAAMLLRAITGFVNGTLPPQPQAGEPTYTKPIRKEDLLIDWKWPVRDVVNAVRAFAPQPAARGMIKGEQVKILRAKPELLDISPLEPGAVVGAGDESLLVKCGEGLVAVERLIAPNHAAESGAAYFARTTAKRS